MGEEEAEEEDQDFGKNNNPTSREEGQIGVSSVTEDGMG